MINSEINEQKEGLEERVENLDEEVKKNKEHI